MRGGVTSYTANKGRVDVRESVAAKLLRENEVEVDPEQVVITCGAMNALFATLAVLLNPGDTVLVPDPGWPNYEMMIEILQGRSARYPAGPETQFLPDPAGIREMCREDPSITVLLVNSPSNPTGAVYPASLMAELVAVAEDHNLTLVSDECYEQIVFSGQHISPASFGSDRVVTVQSLSKTYAMTGWRVGYLAATRPLADAAAKIQEALVACAPSMSQMAMMAALDGPKQIVDSMVESYRARHDAVFALAQRHGLATSPAAGAFYLMLDVSRAGSDTSEIARRLVSDYAVAVAPGSTFGSCAPGLIRVSLATEITQLIEGVHRIAEAIDTWSR